MPTVAPVAEARNNTVCSSIPIYIESLGPVSAASFVPIAESYPSSSDQLCVFQNTLIDPWSTIETQYSGITDQSIQSGGIIYRCLDSDVALILRRSTSGIYAMT
jgi:hypothetical protein